MNEKYNEKYWLHNTFWTKTWFIYEKFVMLYKKKFDFRVVHGICRETVQTMREEWSWRNYAWGKTDIVPSFSSSCSSFDREPLYGNVMKKQHNLGVNNASKWCSYSVRETHTLYSNEKCRHIWKFVILKLKSTDTVFNGTKIKFNLFERTSEHQNSFRPSASQSVSSI